jgi:hypothetical protein
MTLRIIQNNLLKLILALCLVGKLNADELPAPLTPAPPPTPRINGSGVFGARPGSEFLYTIPATGDRPMTFSADNLPAGLKLDANTGRITGELDGKGTYPVMLQASNALGAAEKKFRIIVGDQIALTPPMGWNSWNCWAVGGGSGKSFAFGARAGCFRPHQPRLDLCEH